MVNKSLALLNGLGQGLEVLDGDWHLDQTHLFDEFSFEARLVMVVLTWFGCVVGLICGSILFHQTIINVSSSSLRALILLEELSAMVRSATILIFSENILTRHPLAPPAFCITNTTVSLLCVAISMTTNTAIAFLRFIYVCHPDRFRYFWGKQQSNAAIIIGLIVAYTAVFMNYSILPNSILNTTCINVGKEMAKIVIEYSGNPISN